MTRIEPHRLTKADITKIEQALDTNDLEFMVAAVDQIVHLRLRAARKAASATQKNRRRR